MHNYFLNHEYQTMIIKGMMGLGDSIYSRAFVKNYPGAYLETPWPELFRDLDVKRVRPTTQLRTQAKNIGRQTEWHRRQVGRTLAISYGQKPIIEGLRAAFRCEPQVFDLPDFGPSPVAGRYVVVRPVTVRSEWRADSRNPRPEYVFAAAEAARAAGYLVVSVADLEDGKEWAVGELPPDDLRFHAGELHIEQLMALCQHAAAIIGGVGWLVPFSIASHVPALVICGGQGGWNAPSRITDPIMDTDHITFMVPDNFCMCREKQHNCDKTIADYDRLLAEWIDRLPAVE